jgi:translation initiation factor 1
MKREKKKKLHFSESPEVTLGELLGLSGQVSSGEEERSPDKEAEKKVVGKGSRIVLRRERKGRKGKTVTLVEGLGPHGPGLDDMARRMRRDLGCGSHVEGDVVVLQGDQVERAFTWLGRNGFTRVVKGC